MMGSSVGCSLEKIVRPSDLSLNAIVKIGHSVNQNPTIDNSSRIVKALADGLEDFTK